MAMRRRWTATNATRFRSRPLAFETLDERALLAVLTVGPGKDYTTIQAAVNNARPLDEIVLSATGTITSAQGNGFKESVNLSLMGSAVGSGPGQLTIRGADIDNTVVSAVAGGSAFYTTQTFTGNLTFEKMTLFASTATAAREAGISLTNYSGSLTISDVRVIDAVDAGVEIVNSSGQLQIKDLEITADSIATPIGLRMVNYAASGYVIGADIYDATDAAMLIELSGTTHMDVMLLDLSASRRSDSAFPGNDGLRVTVTNSARLDLGMSASHFDDLPGNTIELTADGTSIVNASLYDSFLTINDGVARTVNEPAFKFSARGSSQLGLYFERNFFGNVPGRNVALEAIGASRVNASLSDNLFLNPGKVSGDDTIAVFSDSSSVSQVNAKISDNQIFQPFHHGISVRGDGGSIFNVVMETNLVSYVARSSLGEPAMFSNTATGIYVYTQSNSSAQVSARIVNNSFDSPRDPSIGYPSTIKLSRDFSSANSLIKVEGDTSFVATNPGMLPILSYLSKMNSVTVNAVIGNGTTTGANPNIVMVAPNSLLATLPLTIGDLVWNDTDKNGRRSQTETGSAGTLLTLVGTETVGGATVTRKAWTDAEGKYILPGLRPGTYTITLTPPAGKDLTGYAGNRVSNDAAIDSDFRQGLRTATVTLAAGIANQNIDAGLIPTDGKLWKNQALAQDVNDDGVVTPLDALLVIIELNTNGPRAVLPAPTASQTPQPFVDVDGNNASTPMDALLVIIFLNASAAGEFVEVATSEVVTSAPSVDSDLVSDQSFSATDLPTSANTPYFSPDFFAPLTTNSTSSMSTDDDVEGSVLDAFFAQWGH